MISRIYYILVYIIITGGIIFYFFKDKYINEKIEYIRKPLLEKITTRFNIKKELNKNRIKEIFDWVQTIIIALILVFIIQVFYLANYTVPTSSMYPTIKPGERFFADKVSYKFRNPERGEIIVFKEPFNNEDRYTKRLIGLPGEYISIKHGDIYINKEKLHTNPDIDYYTNNTLINKGTWKIPKKGDHIKLVKGLIRYNNQFLQIDTFREMLKGDKSIINNIYIQDSIFTLNNKELTGPIYDRDILLKLIEGEDVILESDYYFVLGDNSKNSFDSRYWGFVSEERLLGKMLIRFWPLTDFGLVK